MEWRKGEGGEEGRWSNVCGKERGGVGRWEGVREVRGRGCKEWSVVIVMRTLTVISMNYM